MAGKGWICPICRAWNRDVDVVCVNTAEHDGEDD